MKLVTRPQLTKIHVLLNQFGIMDDKAELVRQFTNGRETSSKQLTFYEAKNLLLHLSRFDPLDKMRKKVYALAYNANIIYGDTPEDKKINTAKLNMFLKERGTVKKELNKMNNADLVKVITQFQQIIKHKEESKASKATKSLLHELDIQTAIKRTIKPL